MISQSSGPIHHREPLPWAGPGSQVLQRGPVVLYRKGVAMPIHQRMPLVQQTKRQLLVRIQEMHLSKAWEE